MSKHPVSITSPFLKRDILDVPPPMSIFATYAFSSFDILSAPAPLPAIIPSRSGPAVATTKSPANILKFCKTSLAFSFLAVSPVIITAPVFTSSGKTLAFLYSN